MPFVKLDTGILDSSLWSEPAPTCKCWVTLLAMMDATGLVRSTAPGISKRAHITLKQAEKALATFEAPDPNSRSLNDEGRRIKRLDGGYQVINSEKYRKYDYTAAERMQRYRERVTRNKRNGSNKTVTLRKQKQSTEADADKQKQSEEIYLAYPYKVGKPDALKAIRRALVKFSFDVLISKTKAFAATRNGDLEFCPNPSTWFNQERFNDDPKTWRRGPVVRQHDDAPKKIDSSKIDLPDRFKSWAAETYPDKRETVMKWRTWADVPGSLRSEWWREEKCKLPIGDML